MNEFVSTKYQLIFKQCHYFILFLSNSGAVSVKIGGNQFPVGYKFMSVKVLCSTNGLLVLILRVLIFFFTFEPYCIVYEFILFPCQIITLLATLIEGKHSMESA